VKETTSTNENNSVLWSPQFWMFALFPAGFAPDEAPIIVAAWLVV